MRWCCAIKPSEREVQPLSCGVRCRQSRAKRTLSTAPRHPTQPTDRSPPSQLSPHTAQSPDNSVTFGPSVKKSEPQSGASSISTMPWTNNNSDMANYMFLMQTGNITMGDRDLFVLTKLTLTGCGLSILGALLSLFLVCYVPMRSDGLFSIGNMCVALLSAQLAFAGAENAFPTMVMCKISAAVLHYLFLTFHCWALAYSLHLIMKLCRVLPRLRWKRRCLLVTVGWVVPLVVVALTAVIDSDSYKGDSLCWLNSSTNARWAFVGPVICIAVINATVMVLMLFMRYLLDTKREVTTKKKAKHLLATVASLFPVSSLPWLVGLAPSSDVVWQYMFVIINSSQGFFILVLHMMLSTQIRSLLRKRMNGEGEEKGDHMSKSGSTGGSNDFTESSVVNVGCGMKNIASRRT